jgi:hypothetical protein
MHWLTTFERSVWLRLVAFALVAPEVFAAAHADDRTLELPLSFEAAIRPIVKAHCFQCHGERDELAGGLDLRLRRSLVAGGDSGPAIVAGKPEESYLLERVRLGEMPPGEGAKKLSEDQVALIERWIAEGAVTARPEPENVPTGFVITDADREHWSFQAIRRPEVPSTGSADRARNPIDAFLLERLAEHGQSFAADAEKRILIRRAYFDLIGLPPSPEEVDAFLADASPGAYERLLDRLLDSPHYGERWGRHWLDVAGYADSEGAAGDALRSHAYRYRDYVIRSFNADKPYDEFICEQLAGDEMAGPISGDPTPQQAEMLIATGFLQMAPDATNSADDKQAAHDQLLADTIKIVSNSLLGLTVGCARCHDHRFDPISQDDYYRLRAIFEPAFSPRMWQGRNRLIPYFTDDDRRHLENLLRKQEQAVIQRVVEQQLAKLSEDDRGAARTAYETPEAERTEEQKKLVIDAGLNITTENVQQFDRTAMMELNRLRQRLAPQQRGFIQAIRETGGPAPKTFLFHRGDYSDPRHELAPGELTILQGESDAAIELDDPALPSTGRRLAYARRLTDGDHPLVARVIVNRVWMHHFGRGLSSTPIDLGAQGEPPVHRELLDWLASEFMGSGWRLKQLHKQIMSSTAYRQGPLRDETLQRIDPENRLLGAFPTRRLEAEIVRDAILAVSGALNRKQFCAGVPVMNDPSGEIVVGLENSNAGIPLAVIPLFGEEFRRSVYLQARRTMPLTFLQLFDAPLMEPNCEARATSTAAPQSLVLMNSPFMLEQSLSLAERVLQEAGTQTEGQIDRVWKLAFSRAPSADELADAMGFLKARADYFRERPPAAVSRGVLPGRNMMAMRPQKLDMMIETASKTDPELLALALLCQMLMSSNEFLYVG